MKPLDVLMPCERHGDGRRSGRGAVPPASAVARARPRGVARRAWAHDPRVASAGGHGRSTRRFMRRLPKLEIVASFGVGYDHIDAEWAGEHGIVVTHTPGVLDDEVADVAIGADDHGGSPAAAGRALSARRRVAEGAVSADRVARAAGRSGFSASAGSARRSPGAPKRSGSRSSITAATRSPASPYRFYPSLRRWPRPATS